MLEYCTYSATPVGQMVLAVLGHHDDAERVALSDQICIGLQVANFWQDVSVDIDKGRVYLPQEDLRSFGCDDAQIVGRRFDERFRELMRFQVERARSHFAAGPAPRGPRLALRPHRHPPLPPRGRGDPRRDRGLRV